MDEGRTGDAAVTGVARGALGSGTALDETQEWVIPEGLQAKTTASDAAPEPVIPARAPIAGAAAAPVEPVEREAVTRRPATPTVTRHPAPATATSGARFSPGPRTAGIAAAILLALVGVAAVVTTLERDDAGAATPAQVPSAAPTQAPAADDDGDDDGDGGGKKDNDDGNGGGRGNGNGNGNGGGNGGGRGNGNGDD
jgi:uncharacterized membrane protein YgcG